MNNKYLILCLIVTIVTTNLIRILPVTVIRKKITNRFLRSFLYYVPYVTLAIMTVPAIFETTENPATGICALIAGIIAAWFGFGLFPVAIICCLIVFLLGLFF